jgi:CheY-like chemotaxis protein
MPAVSRSGGTVLIAEDEPAVADRFVAWLAAGYDVRTAHSGADVLASLDAAVDVVLLADDMADLVGDDVFVALRDRDLDCLVVLVGADIDPELERGFDAYLEAPVTERDLTETVETLLGCGSRDDLQRELSTKQIERNVLRIERSAAELEGDPRYTQLERDISLLESRLARLPQR